MQMTRGLRGSYGPRGRAVKSLLCHHDFTRIFASPPPPTHILSSVSARHFHLLLRDLAIADDTVWKRSDVICRDQIVDISKLLPYIHFFFFTRSLALQRALAIGACEIIFLLNLSKMYICS